MIRLKREECKSTKHDPVFSEWKILIGPNDWKNYSMGKDGTERYRIHNLPISCSCPGLYELGIAASRCDLGRDIGKLDHNRIIVVYLGQAENVRTRLQHYGRAGSHLDNGNSFGFPYDCKGFGSQKGPGLFMEIFSRGFPIVFRWTRMENKKEAQKTEALLLGAFDYAWNKGGNGIRRSNDVLLKLDETISKPISFTNIARKLQHWMQDRSVGQKKVGIRIKASTHSFKETKSPCFLDSGDKDLRSRIFKFGRSQPLLVTSKCGINDEDISGSKGEPFFCGVALEDGSMCVEVPAHGSKRCDLHIGRTRSAHITTTMKKLQNEDLITVCRVPFVDGSVNKNRPITGREVDWEHKEKIFTGLVTEEKSVVCGVIFEDGSICMEVPVHGRKRCESHKGRRINGSISRSITEGKLLVCGVGLGEGSTCMEVPVKGRKRCELHKGKRVNNTSIPCKR